MIPRGIYEWSEWCGVHVCGSQWLFFSSVMFLQEQALKTMSFLVPGMVVTSIGAVVLTLVYECSPPSIWRSLMLRFWSHISETYPLGVFRLISAWELLLPGRKRVFWKTNSYTMHLEESHGGGDESLMWSGYERQLWRGRQGFVKFSCSSRKPWSLKIWCTYSFSAWAPEPNKEI